MPRSGSAPRRPSLPALTRGGGLLLPVIAVAGLALILVPLPPALVDVLLSLSLGLSLWLLALSLGAASRESLAFLPNALVLFTLFRLALNLGTTRLILGTGEGGEVIAAFGRFMVGGSYLVGGVVFAIITIVQLFVIARGTSRVAEVSARFSLDGLPGRQQAIDSELAAHAIDASEARRRRAQMERESFLHGGLDGAMRFVQGDALAGLLITGVNLVGGLAVGTLRLGMDLSSALQHFALLTIGDGLATQVPSLLTATATGLVVTRVAGSDPATPPGEELSRQLLGRPGLLFLVAGVLAFLALLPGLPLAPFLLVALVLAGLGLVGARQPPATGSRLLDPPLPARLVLELGSELQDAAGRRALEHDFQAALQQLSSTFGLPVPLPQVAEALPGATSRSFRLLLDGYPVTSGTAARGPDEVLALAHRLTEALLPRLGELLGVSETRRLLDRLGVEAPDLVRAVVPERCEVPVLAAVLRGLLRGGIPVLDLRGILEALAAAPPGEQRPELLLERVRVARRRQLSQALADPGDRIEVLLVDRLIEDALLEAFSHQAPEGTLRLDRALLTDLRAALHQATARWPRPRTEDRGHVYDLRPVLLTTPAVRRHLEAALAGRARVITGQEVDPEVRVESVGVFGPG